MREVLSEAAGQGGGTPLTRGGGLVDTVTPCKALELRRRWLGAQARCSVTGVSVSEEAETVGAFSGSSESGRRRRWTRKAAEQEGEL